MKIFLKKFSFLENIVILLFMRKRMFLYFHSGFHINIIDFKSLQPLRL